MAGRRFKARYVLVVLLGIAGGFASVKGYQAVHDPSPGQDLDAPRG